MNTHHVGRFQDFVNGRPTEIFTVRLIGRMSSVAHQFHAESRSEITHFLPDIPEPDDAHDLSCEFNQWKIPKTEIRRSGPFAGSYGITVLLHMETELQQQAESHLHNRVRTITRYVGNHNLILLRRIRINDIKSGCRNSDVP